MKQLNSLALLLALLFASAGASAQVIGTRYDTGGDRPGVRVGIGLGASIYNGPNTLYPLDGVLQENVTEVRPAVTAFVDVPLAGDRLYGRLLAGLLNIGADNDNIIASQGGNPFLTNEQLLVEGDLMLKLGSDGASVAPYVFGGIGAIIADPFGNDDVASALDRKRVAYVLPVGLGLDVRLSRNLSLFGEASYRFPLNNVGEGQQVASDFFELCDGDPDCIAKCEADPTAPECVLSDGEGLFDTKFGSGLLVGGLKLGFGGSRAPVQYIPPVPPREVIVQRPPVVIRTPEPPLVCDLVELNSIYFDHGSSTLTSRAQQLLNENIELVLDNSTCCIFLDGFTDTSEYDRFGMGLAGRRAQAVYDYYLTQGVGASRLQIRNRGVASPACDKEDPGIGCSRNRRVDSLPMDCERFRLMLENPSSDLN